MGRFERSAAKKRGDKRYFNGTECPKGHIAERMTINGRCVQCMKNYKILPKVKERSRQREKELRYQDPEKARAKYQKYNSSVEMKLTRAIRVRMRNVVKGLYSSKSFNDIFGYTREELMRHLERQFLPKMTWDNYGKNGWHIDHIVPVCEFDYKCVTDKDFKMCWSLANLRPLWGEDNNKKSSIRTHLI